MGSGISTPLGNSHGNHAQLHRDLVAHALLRRKDIQEISARGEEKNNTELEDIARQVVKGIEREGQRNEERSMMKEDKKKAPIRRRRGE